MKKIELNANAAAEQFGVERDTVLRGLKRQGLACEKGETFSLFHIYRALMGEYDEELLGNKRA